MFLKRNRQQKRNLVVGLDLGTTRLKATVIQRNGAGLELVEYAVRALPSASEKSDFSLAGELQALMSGLKVQERRACVAISCNSAMVCHTEFPRMPIAEVKSALKLNSSRYLRRDFSNYYLDAVELTGADDNGNGKKSPKMRVLVGGANRDEVCSYRDAMLAAKIRPEVIELAAVSVVNAFQISQPELCQKEAVLLVDIGARSTSINFLQHGQPVMTRIMHFGGLQLSEYVAQVLTLSAAEAEEEKLKMSDPVQALIKAAIAPLARELRSSIDFFERQHECHVGAAFACGGTAASPHILDFLSEAAGLRVACWNPIQNLGTAQLNGDGKGLAEWAPSLAVAIGVAAARL